MTESEARALGGDDARVGRASRHDAMNTVAEALAYEAGYREGWRLAMEAGLKEDRAAVNLAAAAVGLWLGFNIGG